jgi:hypothetical protein
MILPPLSFGCGFSPDPAPHASRVAVTAGSSPIARGFGRIAMSTEQHSKHHAIEGRHAVVVGRSPQRKCDRHDLSASQILSGCTTGEARFIRKTPAILTLTCREWISAQMARTMMLVYSLPATATIYQRFWWRRQDRPALRRFERASYCGWGPIWAI